MGAPWVEDLGRPNDKKEDMDPYRTNKLNQSILEVLSQLLQVSVKDPRVGFVTLNGVKLNRDHSVAEVFYSVMGDDEDRKKSFQGLKKAKGFMQSKLVRTLGLRQAPDLRFFYDDSVEKGLEMDNLLNDLAAQGEFLTEDEKKRQMTLDDLQPPAELITRPARGQVDLGRAPPQSRSRRHRQRPGPGRGPARHGPRGAGPGLPRSAGGPDAICPASTR